MRTHGPRRPLRDTSALAVGSVVSGLLAYVFFAMVTRALGPEPAAPVSVLWAWWSFAGAALTFPLQPKMIQDEMGEAFEHEYGRMSGFLGVETPNAQAGLQNMILYSYTSPPSEVLDGVELPEGVDLAPITTNDDGTQIWKITHNGVDTHPIHFHLYDVQLINRVGWDGIIRSAGAFAAVHTSGLTTDRERPIDAELKRFVKRAGQAAAVDPATGARLLELAKALPAWRGRQPE